MSSMVALALLGMPGHLELLIVAFVILLLFGNRLPSVMRSLGQGIVEFKKGVSGQGGEDEPSAISDESDGEPEHK